MKDLRNLGIFLLTFLLLLSHVFIGIKDVNASVTSPDLSRFKVIEPDTEYSQEVWLEVDNNTGETSTLSEVDEDFLEKVRKEYKSPEKVIPGLNESNEFQMTNDREPTFNPFSSLIRLYYHIEVMTKTRGSSYQS
ncbi:hypothetical protein [Halalkalibacterium halodurans]|uniref:hypothetical protein n=1 Tax=Halalkalibacterium halodurans TaxID=86665 RepID=UPI002AA965DF|nr:hypothetical protein [Halalkalibacterium halodurans]MDY7224201.1 hypothetical protein [Halalkalibacterium halodurans]MDY7243486.1 hypothetical protein [Halalkalibacterium halodurans]